MMDLKSLRVVIFYSPMMFETKLRNKIQTLKWAILLKRPQKNGKMQMPKPKRNMKRKRKKKKKDMRKRSKLMKTKLQHHLKPVDKSWVKIYQLQRK